MTLPTSWHPPSKIASINPAYGVALREWLAHPVGKRFMDLEMQRIGTIMPTLFGYDAVLIGEPNFAVCMQKSTIKNQYQVNEDISLPGIQHPSLVFARQDRLPIGSTLIDVVYLAHCLEFASNPHEVLREAYRILRADGHLVISMFNSFSLWGMWRGVAKLSGNVPWKANFMNIVKLKDWLALLGFDIMQVHYFGFNLPFGGCNSHTLPFFERYGQKLDLPFGAGYLIEASKRVIPLTPITQVWHAEPDIIQDDVAEPTA